MHDLEREIVAKMGDATIPQVKVVTGALLEMGLFTLNSLLETPVDKERMVTIMEKRAATAMIESFKGEVWARTLKDFTGIKFESGAARVAQKPLPLDDITEKGLKPSLCAPAPKPRPPVTSQAIGPHSLLLTTLLAATSRSSSRPAVTTRRWASTSCAWAASPRPCFRRTSSTRSSSGSDARCAPTNR